MSKFCIYCGSPIEAKDKFCPKCGKAIKHIETFQPSISKEEVIETSVTPTLTEVDDVHEDSTKTRIADVPVAVKSEKIIDNAEKKEAPISVPNEDQETVLIKEDVLTTDDTTRNSEATLRKNVDDEKASKSEQPAKKKRNKKLLGVILASVAVVAIIAVVIVFTLGIGNSEVGDATNPGGNTSDVPVEDAIELPALTEFESLMAQAIVDFYNEAGIDANEKGYVLQGYKATDMTHTDAVYEYMISATYGPNKSIGLMGTANDDKVEYVFTYLPLIGVDFTTDNLMEVAPMLMVPVTLFNDDYSSYEELKALLSDMLNNGVKETSETGGETTTLTVEGIEYQITVSSAMLGFTVNARDLANSSKDPNNTEQNDTTISLPADMQSGYAAYDKKISEYLTATKMSLDEFNEKYDSGSDCSSINSLIIRFFHNYGDMVIKYSLFDVDSNDIPELIFCDGSSIIDVYALDGDKAVKLYPDCYFGDRSRLHVLSNGRLLTEGSSGASSSSCEMKRIGQDGKSLESVGAFYYDDNGKSSYMDETHSYISRDEYSKMTNDWLKESQFSSMPWKTIAGTSQNEETTPGNNEETKPGNTVDTPIHIHSYGDWVKNNDGITHSQSCTCGEKKTELHTYNAGVVTKEPTISSTGTKTFTCTKCSAIKTETVPAIQHTHSYGDWETYSLTEHAKYCTCGDKKTEAHTFDSGVVTNDGSTTGFGIKRYTCTVCGFFKEETFKTETRNYDYQCICNYCDHDDGIMHLVLHNGVKVDVKWNCSSCGKENWNYMTLTW